MYMPAEFSLLHHSQFKRDAQQESARDSRVIFLSVSAAALIFLTVVLLSYTYIRRRGVHRKLPPSRTSWQFWRTRNKSYGQVSTHDRSQSYSGTPTTTNDRATSEDESAARSAVEAGVDRNTSVRSVMTLPAYSQAPKESEQVIGREGERAGMDTVVEFPETVDEEEARRDEEMESLYQIRLARRREVEERERRRQERREARARGDFERLEELRLQSRLRAEAANAGSTTDLTAATMLAEHQSRGRDRRVSSVSYADVGHVRHDGSRLRANSEDSERGGLLDGAAPMGEGPSQGPSQGPSHSRVASGSSSFFSFLPHPRLRGRSPSSLSISTAASELDTPQPVLITPPAVHEHVRSSSGQRSPRGYDLAHNRTSSSSPAMPSFTTEISGGSDDVGESHIPPPLGPSPPAMAPPPEYDDQWGDAPAYISPVQDRDVAATSSFPNNHIGLHDEAIPSRRDGPPMRIASKAPRLPQIDTLPSISVEGATEPNTPASPVRRQGTSVEP
ncbi:hypothetical protein EPUS_07543 [Endocarpon pusillum Z07020]|uniref:Uncharacterized protein n=1 Tax=Endocarpon pusillum (strain Z07020 / HMAS-L-300199) TaxID=1263415 RepID=U1GKH2_ENDPU|nr:uncharacterized protein EPUS_07543 [Endocarpon pusillum Z07020]ERF72381.1 hypothetical protein EPUS_07543 [Endocarpon pusillum Z07020]